MNTYLNAALLVLLFASLGHAAPGGTISGTIKGTDGAPFRAAFVRAQNIKTGMTMMVLSDSQGKYWTDKLPTGTYQVWATALGYKSDPDRRAGVVVDEGKTAPLDFAMKKSIVRWDQLTKYQAGVLLPDAKGKDVLLQECFNCHAFDTIGTARHDRDGWLQAIDFMRQVGVATISSEVGDQVADYLATVYGPDSDTPQSPAQLPKYQGVKQDRDHFSDDALNIVYVDYQLTGDPKDRPGTGRPDKDGNIWMEDGGGLSKLNPTTGALKTWRLPDPTRPFIHEVLPTPDGSVWLTIEAQNKVARFDPRTEKFQVFGDKYEAVVPQLEANAPWPELRNTPGDQTGAPRRHTAVADLQGNIWSSGRPLAKLDPKTGEFKFFPEVPDCYGIAVDKEGNVWFAEFNSRDHHSIGRVDVATNKITKWTPPNPGATPRRLKIDSQGMVWFGDYFGGNLTRFDPKAQTFKVFKLPGPMPTPYGVAIDHNDNIWYASMYTDVMGQLDPRTGKVTEYPSPYGEKGTRDMTEDSEGRIWYGAQPYFRVGYIRLRTESEKPVAQIR